LENHAGKGLLQPVEHEIGGDKERPVVQAEAKSRLRNSGYHELRHISCEFHEGVLTLRGRVSTFCLKQVAQELIRRLDGAGEVNNRLEVASPPCSP
jgi:osmotically-inducible protein OsmY